MFGTYDHLRNKLTALSADGTRKVAASMTWVFPQERLCEIASRLQISRRRRRSRYDGSTRCSK